MTTYSIIKKKNDLFELKETEEGKDFEAGRTLGTTATMEGSVRRAQALHPKGEDIAFVVKGV